MLAKLERTPKATPQNKNPTQNPTYNETCNETEQQQTMNKQHQNQLLHLNGQQPMPSDGLNAFYWLNPRFWCCYRIAQALYFDHISLTSQQEIGIGKRTVKLKVKLILMLLI